MQLLRNCTSIGRILSICANRFSDQPTLVPVIVDLIKICSLGLITQGTSHEAAFEKQAIYLIDELCRPTYFIIYTKILHCRIYITAQLIMCSSDEVRQAVCHCFLKLFSTKQLNETYQGTQRCSLLYNRFIIEQSDLSCRLISVSTFNIFDIYS